MGHVGSPVFGIWRCVFDAGAAIESRIRLNFHGKSFWGWPLTLSGLYFDGHSCFCGNGKETVSSMRFPKNTLNNACRFGLPVGVVAGAH
jgi:hypothetical protein